MRSNSIKYFGMCLLTSLLLSSFNKYGYDNGKSFASSSKIIEGKTNDANVKTSFNAGEEIYVYMPLKKGTLYNELDRRTSFGMDVDGKSVFRFNFIPYNAEGKLTYFVFGLAVNPCNHMPDNHPRKEALTDDVLKELAKISVGSHKVKFGITNTNGGFDQSYEFTITVTEEGQKTWETWAQEIESMNKIYSYKTK